MKPKHGKAGQKVKRGGVEPWELSFQPCTRAVSNMSQNCPPKRQEGAVYSLALERFGQGQPSCVLTPCPFGLHIKDCLAVHTGDSLSTPSGRRKWWAPDSMEGQALANPDAVGAFVLAICHPVE